MFRFLTFVREHTPEPRSSYIVLKLMKSIKNFYVVNVMWSVAACHGMVCVLCSVLS
jgi:histone acetyltransferase (RNA polymerase elongator complex component)